MPNDKKWPFENIFQKFSFTVYSSRYGFHFIYLAVVSTFVLSFSSEENYNSSLNSDPQNQLSTIIERIR